MSLATVDREGVVPLYHQLFASLRDQILAGAFRPGQPLPSEREMARLYGVSRITTQRAIEELEREGLIRREQGRGTFVAEHKRPAPVDASLQALFDSVVAIGASTSGRIVSLGNEVPPADVREAMHLGPREAVQCSRHLRLRDGAAIGLFHTYVPVAIGRHISAAEIEAKPMLLLLEAKGVRTRWATQTIGVALADAATATLLGVAEGSPLVRLQRIVYDAGDRPVEYLVALYRGDRYEHRSVLRRAADGAPGWALG